VNNIRFIGRHIQKDEKESFSFSGSGFEFIIFPKSINASITLFLDSELRDHDAQYISIFLNEKFDNKVRLISGENRINIKLNSDKKTTIRVIKENEAYLSSIALQDIVLDNATFGENKSSKRKLIGFFGDSITCGFGVVDYKGQEFKMETEEFSKTYAYLASFVLKMDYSAVCRSGISLAVPIFVNEKFEDIYDTVDYFQKGKEDRQLDYAVINLGANDRYAILEIKDQFEKTKSIDLFKQKYIELISRIICDNPNVKIVIAYKMLPLENDIIEAIKEVYETASLQWSNKFEIVEFVPNDEGACNHPYKTAHEINAKILTDIIRKIEEK